MTREEINEGKQKEINRENNRIRNKKIVLFVFKTLLILSVIVFSFIMYTTYVSSVLVSVREYRITNQKIPSSFDGLKIVQFSDLHYGSTMFEDNLKQVKKLINERKPDIIVFTGDLILPTYKIKNEEKEMLAKHLSELSARLGKYAVLGDEDDPELVTIFNQSDFNLLENSYDLIYNDDMNPLLIIGLGSKLKKNQDIDSAYQYFKQEGNNPHIYTIALVHEPDSTTDILDSYPSTDLILSGHSLNGTIRTPFYHIPVDWKNGAKKYHQDFYQVNNTQLYVSSGLGTNNISIRLFCRPSINFFRLSNE